MGASHQEVGLLTPRSCPLLGPFQEPPLCPQVSHHPPVSAFHVSNRKDGFCISGSITAKSRFYGEGGSPGPSTGPGEMGAGRAPEPVVTRPHVVAMCVPPHLS